MLQQDAALPVNNRLGQPGRTGRIENPEWVVKREPLETELGRLGQELLPAARHEHGVLDRRDGAYDLRHALAAVEVLAAVAVALNGDQDLGLDLLEAVHH